jgi:hypothetical protein
MVDFQQAWTRPRLFPRNKWMIEYLRQAMAKIPPGRVFSPLSLARLYAYLQKYSGEINRFSCCISCANVTQVQRIENTYNLP